jgi:PmbA protein
MSTTANAGGYHNLIIPGNTDNQEAIISSMQRGLLVQELIGQGVNNVTGDYSRGAAGYWIENGVIVHPVHEVTISGNLIDLYRNILMIGHDYDERSGIRCGALLIDKLRISGN